MDRHEALSLKIVNANEIGGPDLRSIEMHACTDDNHWVTILFDEELALRAAADLNRLATEL